MATAYPLIDRSGVDDGDSLLRTVALPRGGAPESSTPAPRPLGISRRRAATMLAGLAAANVVLLVSLGLVGARYPSFVSPGVLAFSFGLRHAVDADHLAAIDCVSRKLIADGRPSLGVGLFFSLGHSTVVVLLCVGVAAGSEYLSRRGELERVGAVVGTSVSAGVLLLVGLVNLAIARGLLREWRAPRSPARVVEEEHADHDGGGGTHTHVVVIDAEARVSGPGVLARCCPGAFDVIDRAHKMYLVGFLFGLGFDTASEVALLALTAMGARDGLPPEAILLLPCLFASGMAFVDTLDGILMAWAYQFALKDAKRRLLFNIYITLVSAGVALSVAVVEVLGCLQAELDLGGPFWSAVGAINDHFEYLGYGILGAFFVSLCGALVIFRVVAPAKDDDELSRALLAESAAGPAAAAPPPAGSGYVPPGPGTAAKEQMRQRPRREPYPVFDRSGIDA